MSNATRSSKCQHPQRSLRSLSSKCQFEREKKKRGLEIRKTNHKTKYIKYKVLQSKTTCQRKRKRSDPARRPLPGPRLRPLRLSSWASLFAAAKLVGAGSRTRRDNSAASPERHLAKRETRKKKVCCALEHRLCCLKLLKRTCFLCFNAVGIFLLRHFIGAQPLEATLDKESCPANSDDKAILLCSTLHNIEHGIIDMYICFWKDISIFSTSIWNHDRPNEPPTHIDEPSSVYTQPSQPYSP